MSIFGSIRQFLEGVHARNERRRTEHFLNGLPPEIQKDVGWPGFAPDRGTDPRFDETGLYRN